MYGMVAVKHTFGLQENGRGAIKCVSLFTFYQFQAIKCARRQPSTFYGIEIGKKENIGHILLSIFGKM